MGVDNVIVEIDNLELPILDGSAKPYVEAFLAAGIRVQRRRREYIRVLRPVEVREGDKFIGVYPGEGYSIIEDQRYDWKKGDTLVIPVFAWHQHFNTGKEPARFLVHHNRPYMENMGFLVAEHGEDADF